MLLLLLPTLSGYCVRTAKAMLAASEDAARCQLLIMRCNAGQGRATCVRVHIWSGQTHELQGGRRHEVKLAVGNLFCEVYSLK